MKSFVMALSIPAFFNVGPYEVGVHFRPHLLEKKGVYGIAVFEKSKVVLQPPTEEISESVTCVAYWHEQYHWILFVAGETELNEDEDHVDRIGHLLAQANGC